MRKRQTSTKCSSFWQNVKKSAKVSIYTKSMGTKKEQLIHSIREDIGWKGTRGNGSAEHF